MSVDVVEDPARGVASFVVIDVVTDDEMTPLTLIRPSPAGVSTPALREGRLTPSLIHRPHPRSGRLRTA
jgi:hypothetical protein